MGTAATRYKTAKEALDKAKGEMKKAAKEAFKEMADEFFTANPAVLAIGWKQYTPYFNDGDPCVFGANVDYPAITFMTKDGKKLMYDAGYCAAIEIGTGVRDEDVEFSEDDGIDTEPYQKEIERHEKAVTKFLTAFEEDDLNTMFGDGYEITVNNKGKITVEEYEHD